MSYTKSSNNKPELAAFVEKKCLSCDNKDKFPDSSGNDTIHAGSEASFVLLRYSIIFEIVLLL
jgi:hypothetical protein